MPPPPTSGYVLAFDFGGTKIAIGTAAADGEPALVRRIPTEPEHGAEAAVSRAVDVARELIGTGPAPDAVAAVSPGVIGESRIDLAPNVPGWGDLALADAIEAGLGLRPTALANDVKAATLAELSWGALRGADPAILLSLGTGVAAGLAVGGRVISGAHGAAGEIGYVATSPDTRERAELELRVGGRALAERGSELLGSAQTAAGLFATTNGAARALVDEALDELAVSVANLAVAIDPQRIAVSGGYMGSSERVLDALGARLARAVPFPPELVAARFVADGPLRGAIALALEDVNRRRDAG